jgi:type I restriction enzyme S subunit
MPKAQKHTPVLTPEERLDEALIPIVDQPFEIPENWVWVKLGSLGYTNIGLTYSPKDISEIGTVVLRSSNIQDGCMDYKDIVKVKIQVPKNKMCQKGDILICARNGSKALVGKTAVIDADGMSYGAFMAIFRSEYNPMIFYFLNSPYFRNIIDHDVGTTTINQVTQALIKGLPFPLPPIAEHHRIVAQIENLFEKLDRAKVLVQSALDSFENRKTAILHKAFTGELTANWRKENGVSCQWENVSIERFLTSTRKSMSTGPFGTMIKKHEHQSFGVPVLGIENIGDGEFLYGNKIFVTEEKAEYLKSFTVYENDIIISRSGTVGELCIVPQDMGGALFSTNLIRVTLDDHVMLPKLFVFLFLSKGIVVDQVKELCRGSTRDFLNQTILKQIMFPLPSMLEQKEILRILYGLLEKEGVARELTNTIEKIDHMKKAILARAFRGELGTNDPNEESAVEILKTLK